jgi:signal transduction histidine kinase
MLALPTTASGAGAADLVAVLLLVGGSLALLLDRRLQGTLAVLSAVALVLLARTNQVDSAPASRTLAIVAAPLLLPLAAGAIGGRGVWWRVAIVSGIAAGLLRALVYDPFLDLSCVSCRHNPAVISHQPRLAQVLLIAGMAVPAVALLMLAVTSPRRLPFLLTGLVGGAIWWWPGARVGAGAVAVIVITIDLARLAAAQRRVLQLVRVLHDDVDLEASLRRMLGDPGLTVAYWLDREHRFATGTGGRDVGPAGSQITTELTIERDVVALIHHDPIIAEVAALSRALDGPARLALENECLAVQLASQERELQRSRARIVAQGDIERRLLERDVHDGAQQHMLALGFDLRIALSACPEEDAKRPVLERCLAETMAALDELRDLSHGLYPPSLESGGLSSALSALARRAAVGVSVGLVPSVRLPRQVERTVFALIADSTAAARSALAVDIEVQEPEVEVRISGVGLTCGQVVVDRVAAMGGSLISTDSTIRAVIPCAS